MGEQGLGPLLVHLCQGKWRMTISHHHSVRTKSVCLLAMIKFFLFNPFSFSLYQLFVLASWLCDIITTVDLVSILRTAFSIDTSTYSHFDFATFYLSGLKELPLERTLRRSRCKPLPLVKWRNGRWRFVHCCRPIFPKECFAPYCFGTAHYTRTNCGLLY
jgi:hypothetical protein